MAAAAARRRPLFFLVLALIGCRVPDLFTLRVAAIGPLEPLTPDVNTPYVLLAQDLVYEGLLAPNDQGAPSPALARAWHPLPAGHVYIELDPSRRFSDGSPVRLQDVTASLKAAGFSAVPSGSGLDVAPAAPGIPAELVLTRAAIFKAIPGGVLGTGAFVLVHQDGQRVVLQRTQRVPHRIAKVEFVSYADQRAALGAVLRGECNAYVFLNPRPAEIFDGIPNLQLVRGPAVLSTAIIFNHKRVTKSEREVLPRTLRNVDLDGIIAGKRWSPPQEPPSLAPGAPLSVLTWNADRGLFLGGRQRLALVDARIKNPRLGRYGLLDTLHTWEVP